MGNSVSEDGKSKITCSSCGEKPEHRLSPPLVTYFAEFTFPSSKSPPENSVTLSSKLKERKQPSIAVETKELGTLGEVLMRDRKPFDEKYPHLKKYFAGMHWKDADPSSGSKAAEARREKNVVITCNACEHCVGENKKFFTHVPEGRPVGGK